MYIHTKIAIYSYKQRNTPRNCSKHEGLLEGMKKPTCISLRQYVLTICGMCGCPFPQDTGVSVRKRVIKILRDICVMQPEFPKVNEICIRIIRRITDEEGIKVRHIHVLDNIINWGLEKENLWQQNEYTCIVYPNCTSQCFS